MKGAGMSSKIEQLIDEIEQYIDSCKYQALSNTKIIVNKEEIDELLRELRMKTPDEIKRYQKIISNKEAILNDAKSKAEALINAATMQTDDILKNLETIIAHSIESTSQQFDRSIDSLQDCLEIVKSNRMELRPDGGEQAGEEAELAEGESINLDML